MEQATINSQNDNIDNIENALKTCSTGIGMAIKYSIERKWNGDSSTLVFTPNEGYIINPADFFWLGYFVGRDYDEG